MTASKMVDNFFWVVNSDGRHLLWFISVCGLTNSLRVTWTNELWRMATHFQNRVVLPTDWTTWLGREEHFHNVEVTFRFPLTLISTSSSKSVAMNAGFTSLPSRRCACLLEMTLTVKNCPYALNKGEFARVVGGRSETCQRSRYMTHPPSSDHSGLTGLPLH